MRNSIIDIGRRVLEAEGQALLDLVDVLQVSFTESVELILRSSGHVVVCGIGKSGIVGQKISATLASTGTPSFFLHPAEAFHGDLGRVTSDDVMLLLSNSGETEEVSKLVPFFKAAGCSIISITAKDSSTLAQSADVHIRVSVSKEACALNLAPTSSTTAVMAIGDALAVALMETRGFEPEDFARFHPGGALGRRLLSKVDDFMIPAGEYPEVSPADGILEVIRAMSLARCNMCVVGSSIDNGRYIRRAIERNASKVTDLRASDVMTERPISIQQGSRMDDAYSLMESASVTGLLVVSGDKLVGIIQK